MKTELFNDDYLDGLPDDPLLALSSVCQEFRKLDQKVSQNADFHEDYLSALVIFQSLAASRNFPLNTSAPPPASTAPENIKNIRNYFSQMESEITRQLNTIYLERESNKYIARFDADSVYVFPDDDFRRIQELINEMRDIISGSDSITPKHKRRLLERLERMQKELHKKTSDLDRFWGFIGEVGIAIGKFGKDIKPFVDRVRELTDIVSKAIRIKENLLGEYSPISLPDSIPTSDSDNKFAT